MVESGSDYDIVGIGVSTIDFLTVVESFPSEKSVQRAQLSLLQGGGPVSTALVAASRLGARTLLLDVLGDDWIGTLILKEFEKFGVDTKFISVLKKKTSSIASINVREKDGERTIVFSPGSASEEGVTQIPFDVLNRAKIIHMNGRHLAACKAACESVRDKAAKISFDGGAGRYRSELDTLLQEADICIVSIEFAQAWLGKHEASFLADQIVKNGAELAVVTMGVAGSFVQSRSGEAFHQKAFSVSPVIDTTGCGDVYHGAFLYALAKDYALRDAAELASAAAAIKAQALGGRGLIPTQTCIKKFLLSQGEDA